MTKELLLVRGHHRVNWEEGACYGSDPSPFFAKHHAHQTKAKELCAQCPIQEECRDWAISNNIRHGIWGGLTGKQLKKAVAESDHVDIGCAYCGERFVPSNTNDRYCCRDHQRQARRLEKEDHDWGPLR